MMSDYENEQSYCEINGRRYLAGSAGSIILGCDICGAERFRQREDPNETCWTHPGHRMRAIPLDELETIWLPLWRIVDGDV